MLKQIVLNFFLIAFIVEIAFACNGYKAKIIKSENCAGPEAIISFDPDFSVKLNKDCEIVPTGCVINKAFSTAMAKYKIVKDGVVIKEGKNDICSMSEQATSETKDYLKVFGAPSSCPVAEGKVCGNDHKIDLSKYKTMLSLARGHVVMDVDITHDTGKSCYHIEMEITKA